MNGTVIKDSARKVDSDTTFAEYNGVKLIFRKHVYLMMNKPAGYVSAVSDRYHDTVVDLLPEWCRKRNVVPIGRLDKDTTGLLLFSDDGAFNHFLTSPKHHVKKIYHAQIDKPITVDDVHDFANGMRFKEFISEPAQLTHTKSFYNNEYAALVTLYEGKFHQVKRMFAKCGINVLSLERIAIGDIVLPEDMDLGEIRELKLEEVKTYKTI